MDTPDSLAADLLKAAAGAIVVTRAVVQKGALNIKTDAQENVRKSAPRRNAHAAQTINYDTTVNATSIDAEIGYDKDKNKADGKRTGPGGIGNLLEFGGGGDHSPPHRDLGRALDAEEPRFEASLALAIERLL